jgi:hypothetical protein
MKEFKDANGKAWRLDVNLASIEVVRETCKVDLTQIFENGLTSLVKLFEDHRQLAEVLLCLLGLEAANFDKNGIDRTAFLKALKGDALEQAANALVDDVIDFFPNRRQREVYRAAVNKVWETVLKGQDLAMEKILEVDPMPALRTLLNSATSSAESVASTPLDSPSVS